MYIINIQKKIKLKILIKIKYVQMYIDKVLQREKYLIMKNWCFVHL